MKINLKKLAHIAVAAFSLYRANSELVDGVVRTIKKTVKGSEKTA